MISINYLVTFLILSAIGNNCCSSTGEDSLTPSKSNAVQSSRMKKSALEELNAEKCNTECGIVIDLGLENPSPEKVMKTYNRIFNR